MRYLWFFVPLSSLNRKNKLITLYDRKVWLPLHLEPLRWLHISHINIYIRTSGCSFKVPKLVNNYWTGHRKTKMWIPVADLRNGCRNIKSMLRLTVKSLKKILELVTQLIKKETTNFRTRNSAFFSHR